MRTPLYRLILAVVVLTSRSNALPYGPPADHLTQEQQDHDQQSSFSAPLTDFLSNQQQLAEPVFDWKENLPSQDFVPQGMDVPELLSIPHVEYDEYLGGKNEFTVSCTGQEQLCVSKAHCVDGYVYYGSEQLNQAAQNQQCNVRYEVCCTLKEYLEPSYTGLFSTKDVLDDKEEEAGAASREQTTSDMQEAGVATTSATEEEIAGADIAAAKVHPPQVSTKSVFQTPLQLGCAAALLCVEERFCTKEGMISTEPLTFTAKDLLSRVALSTCKNPDSGIIGKCCRDPNYVDPWPTANLPANYSGGFDEQGFPTFLNAAKVQPPKKPTSSVKTSPPITKTPVLPIQEGSNMASNVIPIPTAIPKAPRPFTKNHDDSEASDDSSALLPPRIDDYHCGIRNDGPQRKTNSFEPVTSFGEIPWQAMILSNVERSILCSGVVVAPDVVLTAANCVYGLTPNELSVKTGEWKLGYEEKHDEPLPFEITNVTSISIHPEYSPEASSIRDMAILFLNRPVAYDHHVNELCLPDTYPTLSNCIVTGWGKPVLRVHGAGAIMHSIDVDLLPHDSCVARMLDMGYENVNGDTTAICVKAHRPNNNMCQVDVGGPLACKKDGSYELAGLYSQDNGCLPTDQVAVFAPLDKIWLKKEIEHRMENSTVLSTKNESNQYRESNLPSEINQYLPPAAA